MKAVEKVSKSRIEAIDFEKRGYPRFNIHLPIEYYQFKSSITHIGNISEGGSLIYFPEETDVGQYLWLKLFFSLGSELHTIKMLAKVVRKQNQLSKGRKYYPYGIKFVHISPEDATKLRHFLRSLSSPSDDLLCPFNNPKVRFWIRKVMNPPREYTPGR